MVSSSTNPLAGHIGGKNLLKPRRPPTEEQHHSAKMFMKASLGNIQPPYGIGEDRFMTPDLTPGNVGKRYLTEEEQEKELLKFDCKLMGLDYNNVGIWHLVQTVLPMVLIKKQAHDLWQNVMNIIKDIHAKMAFSDTLRDYTFAAQSHLRINGTMMTEDEPLAPSPMRKEETAAMIINALGIKDEYHRHDLMTFLLAGENKQTKMDFNIKEKETMEPVRLPFTTKTDIGNVKKVLQSPVNVFKDVDTEIESTCDTDQDVHHARKRVHKRPAVHTPSPVPAWMLKKDDADVKM
eukprot:g12710.t1